MARDSALTTRIIGGRYKGKRIELPSKAVTRSSKARLRESVFNTLQFDLLDKPFIEMFAGSGSVGLEALSRGAKKAWFIERDRNSFETLRRNCQSVAPYACELRFGDAFEELPKIVENLQREGERAYLYIDPPFSIREGHEEIYEKVIDMVTKIPPETMERIIVEHMSRFVMPDRIGPYRLDKRKKFGKSTLSYYSVS
jgi:16S rRNA (guanine(966)-N(2))-methyltransferase RsmD